MTDKELKAFLIQLQAERDTEQKPAVQPESIPDISEEVQTQETVEMSEQSAVQPTVPSRSANKPRKRDVFVGGLLLLLSMVGVFTLVQNGLAYAWKLRQSSDQQTQIRQQILPLVLMDIQQFDSSEELTDTEFLTAAVWSMLTDGSLADYEEHNGFCTVSAAAVTEAGNRIFGTERSPAHTTIGFTDTVRFYYDSIEKNYLIPLRPAYFGSMPVIQNITEENGSYKATAACCPEQPAWQSGDTEPTRMVEITLYKVDGQWITAGLRELS